MNHPYLAIGSLGNMEIFVIAILVLVLFGAKKLPTFARSLGRSMGEFRKARDEFEAELHSAADSVNTEPVTKVPEQKRIPTTTEV
jgi:sec-independent protein translocase protein TatA